MPRVLILAGPNGAGKTTFAQEFLRSEAGSTQFVNADQIASGLSPLDPDSSAVAAGRIMIHRLDELASKLEDFAIETTLSGRWLIGSIRRWQALGYRVELYYVSLSSAQLSVERVRKRTLRGGHSIPEEVILRRFSRSQELLAQTYKDLVDAWIVYDNSGLEPIEMEYGGKW